MPNGEKKGYVYCMAIGSIVIIVCFLFSVFGSSGKDRTEVQTNTDRAMANLNQQSQLVRSQLDFGAGHVGRAGEAIVRAYELVNQCQRRVEYSKKRIAECQHLVAESRRSLDEARRIVLAIENSDSR